MEKKFSSLLWDHMSWLPEVPCPPTQILNSIMDISGPDTVARKLDHHREAEQGGRSEVRRYSPGPGCP